MRFWTGYNNFENFFVFREYIRKICRVEGQGWEFAHSLICSDRFNQMSDCERFAQIAQDKWATVSDSLRSHMINERFAQILLTKSLKSFFWYIFCTLISLIPSFLMSDVSEPLRSLTKNEGVICLGHSPKMSESLFF